MAAAAIIGNLQTIVSRELSPVDTAVVTVGTMKSGTRWNVVSGHAELGGTIRYFSMETGDALPGMIERVASKTAEAFRATATLEHTRLVPPTINDPDMTALARGSVAKVMGETALVDCPPTMGGEDFSQFMQRVPGCYARFGVRNEAVGAVHPQHSCYYQVDEASLVKAASVYTQVALDFLAK